ncbi:hypothetical protein EJB05_56054, partial [Eragrostis curvula]
MAMSAASHRFTAAKALTVFSVFAVLVADVGGRHHVCHPFSCGGLSNISHPFRRQGDSPRCGPYELVCTDTNATIRIGSGTYYVVSINYTSHTTSHTTFRVVDTDLVMKSSCPLPRWDVGWGYYHIDGQSGAEFFPYELSWATFVNCSHEIKDHRYSLVRCLSTSNSFIYMLTGYHTSSAQNFKPSCDYLAMTPLGDPFLRVPENASYEDVVKFMRNGFVLRFPLSIAASVRDCLVGLIHEFHEEPRNATGIKKQILDILTIDFSFWYCVTGDLYESTHNGVISRFIIFSIGISLPVVLWALKIIHDSNGAVLCKSKHHSSRRISGRGDGGERVEQRRVH